MSSNRNSSKSGPSEPSTHDFKALSLTGTPTILIDPVDETAFESPVPENKRDPNRGEKNGGSVDKKLKAKRSDSLLVPVNQKDEVSHL